MPLLVGDLVTHVADEPGHQVARFIQGGFLNWQPPKKYVKPGLGESTLT